MKTFLTGLAACAALALPLSAFAGGDAPIEAAPAYERAIHKISIYEAEELLGQPEVTFYDVNTLEIWADGYIPGAIFFNVGNPCYAMMGGFTDGMFRDSSSSFRRRNPGMSG